MVAARRRGRRPFDTYTLIANPNHGPVQLDITFFFDDGTQVTVPEDLRPTVPARGRLTMDMGGYWLPTLEAIEGRQLVGRSFSTRISVFQQTGPVIVEHALYWNLRARRCCGAAAARPSAFRTKRRNASRSRAGAA